MPSALVAVPESPSPPRHCRRLRSPLAVGGAAGDFELRHWRTLKRRAPASVPPEIEITNDDEGGSGHRYISLRDILSSPEYAAGSRAACFGGGGGCGDIHMIRHPLVKHAAFAYLQMTPSAREDPGRRRRRWRGPLCRLLLGCLSFIGALFRP